MLNYIILKTCQRVKPCTSNDLIHIAYNKDNVFIRTLLKYRLNVYDYEGISGNLTMFSRHFLNTQLQNKSH